MDQSSVDFGAIPRRVVGLCETLGRAGHEAYLVGGGVRDLVLGRPVHDWDVATSARPEQVQRLFRRTVPVGIQHGTVAVLLGPRGRELEVEVTTYRGDGAYSDGRHPDEVRFVSSLEEDISRRDFTVNAMAIDPLARRLVDPLGGAEHLARRLLCAVGRPRDRFTEDGLRVMRGVRFAAVLEFAVEPDTLEAMAACAGGLRQVSWERIRDELLKLLQARLPSAGIALMERIGALALVLPELAAAAGVRQNHHHPDDVLTHLMRVCDALPDDDPLLRLAGLLHDAGKVPTAAPHPERPGEYAFYGHEKAGAELCDGIARRLKLSTAQRKRLTHLVAQHMFPLEGWSAPGLRRFLRRVGVEHLDDLLRLKGADVGVKVGAEPRLLALEELRRRLEEVQRAAPPLSTRQLALGGGELIAELGLRPGPLVGELQRKLLERVIEDPEKNTREALLAEARELLRAETNPGDEERDDG